MKKRNVVGENIRKFRQKAGLTQEELALESGLSQGYINQLESGKKRFTQKSLELVAVALAIPMSELFREEGDIPQALMVSERVQKYKTKRPYKKKRPCKKEFLTLLNDLPGHIVEHYFILLKLERKIWIDGKRDILKIK